MKRSIMFGRGGLTLVGDLFGPRALMMTGRYPGPATGRQRRRERHSVLPHLGARIRSSTAAITGPTPGDPDVADAVARWRRRNDVRPKEAACPRPSDRLTQTVSYSR
jgi:hypothetical protein